MHFIHLTETEKMGGKLLQCMLVSTSEQLYWGHKTSEEHPGLALGITTIELRKTELFHLWLFLVFRLIHSTFSFLYSSGQAGAFQIGRYSQSLPRSIVKSLRMSACYDSEQLLRMLSQSVLEDEVCSQLRPCPYICINIPSEWVSSLAVGIPCLNFSTKWHLWVLGCIPAAKILW